MDKYPLNITSILETLQSV